MAAINRETTRSFDLPEATKENSIQGELFRLVGNQVLLDQEQPSSVLLKASLPSGQSQAEDSVRSAGNAASRSCRSENRLHEGRIERLRRSDCYQEHLCSMEFRTVNVDPDRELGEILAFYGDCLVASRTPARDRRILKLELRQLVGWHYNLLHYEINEKFQGSYCCEHFRNDPYASVEEQKSLAWRDEIRPLSYSEQPARLIIDSIIVDALFGLASNQLKRVILQQNSRNHRPVYKSWRELNALDLNDYLPNEFLAGRLWILQKLLRQLRSCGELEEVISCCEVLGYEARHCLESLTYADGQTAYSRLKSAGHTQPIRQEIKKLCQWQEKSEVI